MNKQQKKLLVGLVIFLTIVVVFFLVSKKSSIDRQPSPATTSTVSPPTFHNIPPEGTGGDPLLNLQKNRWTSPTTYKDISLDDILHFEHNLLDDAGRKFRKKWTSSSLTQVQQYESQAVRVIGYLVAAKESGPESCNGNNDSLRDYHIWLTTSPDLNKNTGIIVEMTPYWKEHFPEWRLRYVQALARNHSRVRVSGLILWDEEHANEVGKSRGSQWEIHPVTFFEVESGSTWRQLNGDLAEVR